MLHLEDPFVVHIEIQPRVVAGEAAIDGYVLVSVADGGSRDVQSPRQGGPFRRRGQWRCRIRIWAFWNTLLLDPCLFQKMWRWNEEAAEREENDVVLSMGLERSSGFKDPIRIGRERAIENVPHLGVFTVLHSSEGTGDGQEKQQRIETEGDGGVWLANQTVKSLSQQQG
nr:hypothetical protein Iba_chr12fCG12210 [Ipomoea batatas]